MLLLKMNNQYETLFLGQFLKKVTRIWRHFLPNTNLQNYKETLTNCISQIV